MRVKNRHYSHHAQNLLSPCKFAGTSVANCYYLAAMTIAERLQAIKSELPGYCTLVAVTKTHPTSVILQAYEAGHKIFGENKVQELVPKYESLPKDIEWHVIGHLQSNKVKYIAPFVSMIHSVDGLKLLGEINKQAQKNLKVINCLLQVHIAEEETKFGFSKEELTAALQAAELANMKNIRIRGLMGMATFTTNEDQVRKEFKTLKKLFDALAKEALPENTTMSVLSMGMSGDYKLAIEEGSTMVRVGSAIFGQRDYANHHSHEL
jgi:pyridoxal phosphate enzyme (YggS family)